jgi:bacterioferritin-associated ferredoxin
MNFIIDKSQAELIEADGVGKSKSPDGTSIIKVFIKVRKDSQIPEFDAISDFKIYCEGFEAMDKYHTKLAEMLTEMGGMFIEDVLKLKERDLFSALGEELHPKDEFTIPALKALQKAIVNYFKQSGQDARAKKATQELVCFCRHVSNHDIEAAVKNGHDSFEQVQSITGAGTGCGSCSNKTKELIDQYRKTAIGNLK